MLIAHLLSTFSMKEGSLLVISILQSIKKKLKKIDTLLKNTIRQFGASWDYLIKILALLDSRNLGLQNIFRYLPKWSSGKLLVWQFLCLWFDLCWGDREVKKKVVENMDIWVSWIWNGLKTSPMTTSISGTWNFPHDSVPVELNAYSLRHGGGGRPPWASDANTGACAPWQRWENSTRTVSET